MKDEQSWLMRKVDWGESWSMKKLIYEKVDWWENWLMRKSIDETVDDHWWLSDILYGWWKVLMTYGCMDRQYNKVSPKKVGFTATVTSSKSHFFLGHLVLSLQVPTFDSETSILSLL